MGFYEKKASNKAYGEQINGTPSLFPMLGFTFFCICGILKKNLF